MVYIITKSTKSSTKAPVFKPHYNRELGKQYHTASDYYGDLKKRGLEPYNPKNVTKIKPKDYELSKWAKEMNAESQRTKGKVGDKFLNEWKKKGIDVKKAMIKGRVPDKAMTGGFI